jgi:hypothetical protein
MKRLTLMCASVGLMGLALAGAGCGRMDDGAGDGFRGGVPRSETVALNVPGGATSGALTADGAKQGALLGQKADLYVATRVITGIVNGGTAAVLTLVKVISEYPPTTVDLDTAVWGPHTEALSPNTWRLTVTRLEPHKFHWSLDSRAKKDTDADFKNIISGTHTAVADAFGRPIAGFGNGDFTIDWNAAATLPEHDDNVGVASFVYSRASLDAVTSVDVTFKGIQDDKTKEIFDAVYHYVATPGQGGDLQYAEDKDNLPDPGNTGTAKEHFTVHSRWEETGAGRSDLKDSGGDLGTVTAHLSECWDSDFKSVYRMAEPMDPADPKYALSNYGAESACSPSFPAAVYGSL